MISILPGKRQRSSTKENAELWGTQVACGYRVGEETFHPEGGGEPRKAVSRGCHGDEIPLSAGANLEARDQ